MRFRGVASPGRFAHPALDSAASFSSIVAGNLAVLRATHPRGGCRAGVPVYEPFQPACKFQATSAAFIQGRKGIRGWAAGTPSDSDTLRFAVLTGVRPMIEKFPFEKVAESYARMMSRRAQFRVVLTM